MGVNLMGLGVLKFRKLQDELRLQKYEKFIATPFSFIRLTDNRYTDKLKTSWPLVLKRTIPTERPPHVGEVSATFCG
jgi:hypothetical protein